MKCNKCGADIIEGIFYNICMPTHKLCIKCKNIMTLEKFDMINCEHFYKPIILKHEEWVSIETGPRRSYSFDDTQIISFS